MNEQIANLIEQIRKSAEEGVFNQTAVDQLRQLFQSSESASVTGSAAFGGKISGDPHSPVTESNDKVAEKLQRMAENERDPHYSPESAVAAVNTEGSKLHETDPHAIVEDSTDRIQDKLAALKQNDRDPHRENPVESSVDELKDKLDETGEKFFDWSEKTADKVESFFDRIQDKLEDTIKDVRGERDPHQSADDEVQRSASKFDDLINRDRDPHRE